MKLKKMEKLLDESKKNRSVISAYIGNDESYYNFIVLDRNEEFVLAARDIDFQVDGYLIFVSRKIRKMIGAKTTKYEQIMQAEGVLNALSVPKVNLKSYANIYKTFRKSDKLISMDVYNDKYGHCYYIGNVEKVNDKSILFSFFDADGEWYSPKKIKYKDVDVICFEDRYAEVFSKYVTDRNEERA